MITNPAGYVLRRGIDVEYIVDILVVESVFHHTFDVREVSNHSVAIEFFGFTINGDNPVMSVQLLALTLVTEIQVVCG